MFLRDKLKRRKLNPKAEKFSTPSMLKEPSTSENYYNELAEQDENMDEGEQSATSEAPNPANSTKQILKVKVPPITFPSLPRENIIKIMGNLKIEDFNIKLMSIGQRLLLNNMADYSKTYDHLKAINAHFFTHRRADERPVKIILSGLHKMPPNELKNLLINEYQLAVLDVKQFDTDKAGRFNSYYLIFFERGTKLSNLRMIKSIYHTMVYWNYHSRRKSGPTQCRNCQLYGHGSSHCHLPPKCLICSGDHLVSECEVKETESNRVQCANCKQQHLADEYDCPKRKEYIALKNRISNRSQPNKRQPGADYNLSQANFPQLVSTAVAPHNRSNQFSRPLPSYSSVVRNNLNSNRNNANINVQTDLFSPQEIMELTNELIVKLAQCNSRADQFNVIVDLSVKFLYG